MESPLVGATHGRRLARARTGASGDASRRVLVLTRTTASPFNLREHTTRTGGHGRSAWAAKASASFLWWQVPMNPSWPQVCGISWIDLPSVVSATEGRLRTRKPFIHAVVAVPSLVAVEMSIPRGTPRSGSLTTPRRRGRSEREKALAGPLGKSPETGPMSGPEGILGSVVFAANHHPVRSALERYQAVTGNALCKAAQISQLGGTFGGIFST